MTPSLLQELKSRFAAYLERFATDDPDVERHYRLKRLHTEEVCANIVAIARGEGASADQLLLAEAVALFHDLGRFPQYCRYRTFRDSDSVNHAGLSVRVLREEGTLCDLPEAEQRTILQAVALHNVYVMPSSLPPERRFFLALIRDADKLDIMRVFLDHFRGPAAERASGATLGLPDEPGCSPEVLAAIERGEMARLATLATQNDFKLMLFSWVYDLNCATTFRLLQERQLLDALAATLLLGCDAANAQAAVAAFRGLPHRMELVRTVNSVPWYEDSKATNVGSVRKALASFDNITLIAGGKDKGGSYAPLAELVRERVRHLVLIGEAKERIARELGHLTDTRLTGSLEEAVTLAAALTGPGGVVLFSPACSSFDMFKDYAERAERFKALVRALPEERG